MKETRLGKIIQVGRVIKDPAKKQNATRAFDRKVEQVTFSSRTRKSDIEDNRLDWALISLDPIRFPNNIENVVSYPSRL